MGMCDNSGGGGDEFCWHGDYHGLFLAHGCMACSDADKKAAENTWAIYTIPDVHFPAVLHAVCTEGCPNAGRNWPSNLILENTKWTVVNQTSPSSDVQIGCCKRKKQRCDSCDSDMCNSYGFGAKCLMHSIWPGCCSAQLAHGTCECQSTTLECDHSHKDLASITV